MAETTHTLKFRADSRAVKVAGQEIKKAFDPSSTRQFHRELGQLQRRLKDVTAAQVGLVKELQRTEEGTEAYKRLTGQLEAVEGQAKTVRTAITGITSAFKDLRSEQRRGFVAGMAQGLGVAQYIPSAPGMGRRIAGGIIGGGIRRAGGAAMAPFRQPGLGGLTSMIGAIPVVGQMAAGAIQSLAGMYQEAVAYNQARVENLQFLPGMATGRVERAVGAGLRGAARERRIAAETRQLYHPPGPRMRVGGRVIGPTPAEVAREELITAMVAEDIPLTIEGKPAPKQKPTEYAEYTRRARANISRLERRRLQTTVMTTEEKRNYYEGKEELDLTVIAKNMAREQAAKVDKEAKKRAKEAFRRSFGPVELPGAAFGARFGFRAAETQAALTSFMGARGGEYTRGARAQFEAALAARRLHGIQFEQAGAFARMGQPGGGGAGGMDLARVLQIAVQLGLRGSLVPEYLQTLVGLGQQAEKSGVKIDVQEFGRSAALLRAVGIQGPQIGRIAGGMQQAAMDLSQRGVSSPVDMITLRAFGYDPSQGVEGYATAMNKMAGGMDMESLNNLMALATQGAKGGIGGAGRQTSILMMRRFFNRLKTPIGPAQASIMLDAYQQGKLGREHLSMLGRDLEAGERRDAHGKLITRARVGVGVVAGLTQTEAGLEARRIALGTKMAGAMVQLNTASINAAQSVSNFSGELTTLAKWMAGFTKDLSEVTKGGIPGTWKKMLDWMGLGK